MSGLATLGVTEKTLAALSTWYQGLCGAVCYTVDCSGRIVNGVPRCRRRDAPACRDAHLRAIEEAERWGQPTVQGCPRGQLIWAVPLLLNQRRLGGVIAALSEGDVWDANSGTVRINLRSACEALQQRIETLNWTNAAHSHNARKSYENEKTRAEAIHEYKRRGSSHIRWMYVHDEPLLMSAIRRGATPEARGILNGLLVHIMVQCQGDLERSKSFFMELVVTLYRTAIEAGGTPETLLGDNYARMTELAEINDQETLAAWLHTMLDTIIAHIHECTNPVDPAMERAVVFIRTNATQRLRRDEAARVAGFSGAHFSRLLRSRYGRSFTDILTQCRVDEACGLLRKTTLPIATVALRAGFSDQSYFTKVFRKATGKTPHRYRNMHRVQ